MLASLQRLLVFAFAALTLAWGAFFIHLDRPVWAAVGVLAIWVGYAIFLALEFILLFCLQTEFPLPRPSPRQLLRAWYAEATTAPKIFFWRQPFRSKAEPDNLTAFDHGQCGVVLVHGFVCNRGFWNPWMRLLRARRVPFVALDLEPVFGSIDDYPPLIEAAVKRLEVATSLPVVLVGHSMGGIAIRAWMAAFDADARVQRVITIGSPHRGTWMARFARTTNARQLQQDGAWLGRLAALEPAHRSARFTCFFGHCDNIVFPTDVATLDGALNVHIPGTPHVRMAFHHAVFDEVCRRLQPQRSAPL